MQKTKFARNMTLFLVISEILYVSILFFVFYPFMNLNFTLILRGMIGPMIGASTMTVGFAIWFYNVIKKLNYVDSSKESENKINNTEKFIRYTFIILNFIGFPVIMISMTFLLIFVTDKLIRWSTIRIIIVGALIPQTIGVIQMIFLSYQIKDVKIIARISEKKSRNKHSLLLSIFFCLTSFAIFMIVNLFMLCVSREEVVSGLSSNYAYIQKSAVVDKKLEAKGYFTDFINMAKKSTDKKIRQEALNLEKKWSKESRKNVLSIGLYCLIIFILFCFFAYIFAKNISSHISSINERLSRMANLEGDLTKLIIKTTDDDIGELQTLINKFIYNVNRNFHTIFKTANEIIEITNDEENNIEDLINSNKEITETSAQISIELEKQVTASNNTTEMTKKYLEKVDENISSITNQSAMIEELNASLMQLNNSIESISNSTKNAFEFGQSLKATSKNAGDKIKELNETVLKISDKSNVISEIVETISNIAGQTDMLAMNAAIEAAHAGEAGKGFAVVSDEIRKLAENTSDQTKEIAQLLITLSSIISDAVKKSEDVLVSIKNMYSDNTSTINLINDINNSAQEQAAGSNENVIAINQLVEITSTIMNNLENQKDMSKELLKTIEIMDEASSNIKNVGEKQKNYFINLHIKFDNFKNYFYDVNQKLEKLNTKLNKIKLIKQVD